MGTSSIGRQALAAGLTQLAGAADDEGTRRSIGRQVKFVTIATLFLVAVFLTATANAVYTIDQASMTSDALRAEDATRALLAEGNRPSNMLVRQVAERADLHEARLARADAVPPEAAVVPLGEGYVLAYAPRRLGSEVFASIAPIRILAAVAIAAFIGLVLHRLHALARHIDTQRLTARRLATLDPLTGLSNRLHFTDQLAEQLTAPRPDHSALLLLDLDGFKSINDRCGHLAGDRLLQEVAQRLRAHSGPGDVVARLGGDEFAIVRRDAPTRRELAEFAEGLVRLIAAPCQIEGNVVAVTLSVGIARIEHGRPEIEALIRAADAALYKAKARSGGAWEFAAPRRPVAVLEQSAA